ncbi:protein suppressor of hairy wing isoform X1 [Folsomia candida]|uniref:protein suppressor of hairy wing isoform X1 n=1 Tax=Folsomia candida TaxID=158441 RepID=UPI000B8EECFC|nr:protein suppressor of hairy wing isoform X1 [Folsomia candida]XP_035702154.1 protein suppressor of hairy wing isoform X1 [Folsomia candida]
MSSMKDNIKENGKQESVMSYVVGPVFYQCDKCGTFFRSKPLAAIHLWTAGHGKPSSAGWSTVPFPTPILKLDKLLVEAPEIETDLDEEFAASPLFVPVEVEMETEFEFENVVELCEPLEESRSSIPLSSENPVRKRKQFIAKFRSYDEIKEETVHEGFQAVVQGLMTLQNAGNATLADTKSLPPVQIQSDTGVKTKLTCDKCGRTFSTNFTLRRHQEIVKNCSNLTIRERVDFTGPDKRKNRVRQCQRVAIDLSCDKCDVIFVHATSLKRHLSNNSCSSVKTPSSSNMKKTGRIKCNKCDATFIHASSLERHLNNKTCFNVKTPVPLRRKSALPLGRIICGKCGLNFASNYSLERHQTNVKDCSNKIILAQLIRKRQRVGFTGPKTVAIDRSQIHYEQHVKLKTNFNSSPAETNAISCIPLREKSALGRISCDKCGLTFASNYSLGRHQNYVKDCSNRTQLARLRRIRQKHPRFKRTGPIKPKTRTYSERHYEQHMKSHSHSPPVPKGSRNSRKARRVIKCDKCNVTFLYTRSLRRHLQNKTCERRTCPVFTCRKSFPSPPSLQVHIRLVHEKKNGDEGGRQCAICGESFDLGNKLYAHLALKHASQDDVEEENSVVLVKDEEMIIKEELDVDDYESSLLSELDAEGADMVGGVKLEGDEMEEFYENGVTSSGIFDILDPDEDHDSVDDL